MVEPGRPLPNPHLMASSSRQRSPAPPVTELPDELPSQAHGAPGRRGHLVHCGGSRSRLRQVGRGGSAMLAAASKARTCSHVLPGHLVPEERATLRPTPCRSQVRREHRLRCRILTARIPNGNDRTLCGWTFDGRASFASDAPRRDAQHPGRTGLRVVNDAADYPRADGCTRPARPAPTPNPRRPGA